MKLITPPHHKFLRFLTVHQFQKKVDDVFKNSDEYHTTNSYALISFMFKTFGLTQIEIDQILTDDVKTSKPVELCMKSLQQNYDTFKKLYDTYVNQASKFRSESKLKEMIRLISIAKDEIVVCLKEISDIKITSSKCDN